MNFETYLNLVFPNGLSPYEALQHLLNVGVYIVGIGVYAVFIFHFYRFLASRDMFKLDLSGSEASRHPFLRGVLRVLTYVAKYIVIFPIFAFFWFAVLTLILAFLSKDRELSQVLLVALATVSAIRVAAYYHEDLSRDLSKILPFAVLGIFIIDASYFSLQDSVAVLREANNHRELIFYYFAFLVVLEFALRLVMGYIVGLIAFRRHQLDRTDRGGEEQPEIAARATTYPDEEDERPQAAPAAAPAD